MRGLQLSLLGSGAPSFDGEFLRARRQALKGGAWVEQVPGWVEGQDELFDSLRRGVEWESRRRIMYQREVEVPRLLCRPATVRAHPFIHGLSVSLSRRYGRCLDQITLALYRDGQDSVAWHGDRMGALKADTVVAVLTLGSRRHFLLRPQRRPDRAALRTSLRFDLQGGDLLVMGGTCQQTWEHCVPKVASAGPRIAVMFREARPDQEEGQ